MEKTRKLLKENIYHSISSHNLTDKIQITDINLEIPDLNHGDYSTNIALRKAKINGKRSLKLAEEIRDCLKEDSEISLLVERIEVLAPGFINFYLNKKILYSYLDYIVHNTKHLVGEKTYKRYVIEFAHPNTHKIFHIGHLRNISLGESVSRLLEACGNEVVRVNYQGDVGLHIAKCLWALQKRLDVKNEKISDLEKLEISERIKILGEVYAIGSKEYENNIASKKEIQEINKKIYQGNKTILELWNITRNWSLNYFSEIYNLVGTKFDRLYFESEVQGEGLEIALKSLKMGILEKSEGAVIFKGEKYNLDNRVFINSFGLPTYEAKDLGLAKLEFSEHGKIEKCIHVVGPEQRSYFKVIFKVLELLDSYKYHNKQFHLEYAHVVLKNGKMSSREGKVVAGRCLLEEGISKALKLIKDDNFSEIDKRRIAQKVGVGAVKYEMLKYSPSTQIKFDFNEYVSLDGNSGPYLQYTYARINSLLFKGEMKNLELDFVDLDLKPIEEEVLRFLFRFPVIVLNAGKSFAPNLLCNYLFELSQKFNSLYNDVTIIKEKDKKLRQFRLFLSKAVGETIKEGLYLLGIEIAERM